MANRLQKIALFKNVADKAASGNFEEAKEMLAELQTEFVNMYEENQLLKKQLDEVASVLDLSECMEFDGQKYWLVDELDKKGPYCQLCYDKDGVLIRLHEHRNGYKCKACGCEYSRAGNRSGSSNGGLSKVMGQVIPLFVK